MSNLRWGILGDAAINQRLLPAFKASRTADLVAIASRSHDKAQAAAKRDGIPTAHGSYEALLADLGLKPMGTGAAAAGEALEAERA